MVNDLNQAFTKVTEGQSQMKQSSTQFNHIKDNIQLMASRINGISSIIDGFKVASANINDSVENIAAISEEAAAGAEEISASAIVQKRAMEQVSTGATTLQSSIEAIDQLMAQFNLEEEAK
jgi:methyl-accepting chemotaxis protein